MSHADPLGNSGQGQKVSQWVPSLAGTLPAPEDTWTWGEVDLDLSQLHYLSSIQNGIEQTDDGWQTTERLFNWVYDHDLADDDAEPPVIEDDEEDDSVQLVLGDWA